MCSCVSLHVQMIYFIGPKGPLFTYLMVFISLASTVVNTFHKVPFLFLGRLMEVVGVFLKEWYQVMKVCHCDDGTSHW